MRIIKQNKHREHHYDPAELAIAKRPRILQSHTYQVNTGIGRVYITITESNGKPFEIFISIGKTGTIYCNLASSIARLASVLLRAGLPPGLIIKQLQDIRDIPVWDNGELIQSLPDGVAKIIKEYIKPINTRRN